MGEERRLIYESYNWEHPLELTFNSLDEYPLPDPETGTDGGYSGPLEIERGDLLEWECEVDNDLDQALTFGDQALTGEMCNLFGDRASESETGFLF